MSASDAGDDGAAIVTGVRLTITVGTVRATGIETVEIGSGGGWVPVASGRHLYAQKPVVHGTARVRGLKKLRLTLGHVTASGTATASAKGLPLRSTCGDVTATGRRFLTREQLAAFLLEAA